ncbi:MAG: DNA repair protein RecN [bacterium]|nr:DNA repair protein RecN [bacterium]
MLLQLRVKNLALIDEAEVEFGPGLNILTGETGAGKSIIIGSVNIALGGKVSKTSIRNGAGYAYAELLFSVEDEEKKEALRALGVSPDENGVIIVSRKITESRSIARVNDETVTAARLREITGLLIDIHGQHEHQSLLYKTKHLEILDAYARTEVGALKEKVAAAYRAYQEIKKELSSFQMDQEARRREMDFLQFEIEEIENAGLREGEEEELTDRYRTLNHFQKIAAALQVASRELDGDGLGRAIKEVSEVAEFDDKIRDMEAQLLDAEALLSEAEHSVMSYLDGMVFDEGEFREIEERLDVIRGLMAKYGGTLERTMEKLAEKKERLELLEHYEERKVKAEKEFQQKESELLKVCEELSQKRQKAAKGLTAKIKKALSELNFLDVKFGMRFQRLNSFTADGIDEAEFEISTNPGEPVRPLGMVASGGELSRVMLAIKTVLADSDQIPTLIFDEIDTGISGRTAQKVSEKLNYIAKTHQVICITHLPQIASMADLHFEIKKQTEGEKTVTHIYPLNEQEQIVELARLLGGVEITDRVLENAKEMKELAKAAKTAL